MVNSFSQWLSQEKDTVSKSTAPKEEQLAKIEALLQDKERQAEKLGPIKAAEAKLEDAGIEQNRHTNLTSKDVEIQYDGFNILLSRKTEMLKELIELEKLRGVSAEEWEEFNNNFGKFDKSGDGRLDSMLIFIDSHSVVKCILTLFFFFFFFFFHLQLRNSKH